MVDCSQRRVPENKRLQLRQSRKCAALQRIDICVELDFLNRGTGELVAGEARHTAGNDDFFRVTANKCAGENGLHRLGNPILVNSVLAAGIRHQRLAVGAHQNAVFGNHIMGAAIQVVGLGVLTADTPFADIRNRCSNIVLLDLAQTITGKLANVGHAVSHNNLGDCSGRYAGLAFPPRLDSIAPGNIAGVVPNAINADRVIRFQYFEYTVTKERRFRKDGALYEVSPFAPVSYTHLQ